MTNIKIFIYWKTYFTSTHIFYVYQNKKPTFYCKYLWINMITLYIFCKIIAHLCFLFERIKHQLHISLTRCENIKIGCNERERVKREEVPSKSY